MVAPEEPGAGSGGAPPEQDADHRPAQRSERGVEHGTESGTESGLAAPDHPRIDHGDLRPVVEYALLVAREGRRRRPPLDFPDELRAHLDGQHVSKRALGKIRRALDAAPDFRGLLVAGLQHDVTADLVDELGRLWLERSPGWVARVDTILDDRGTALDRQADDQAVRRESKRRAAAEEARSRAETELAERSADVERLRVEIDDLRTDLAKALEEAAEHRLELQDARVELRHARDRERSALEKLATAERDRDLAEQAQQRSAEVRDDVLADRADAVASLSEVVAAVDAAQSLADQLRSLVPTTEAPTGRAERRTPMALPGGVISTSAEAAEFFARSDAAVLVDGYNVSKLTWPSRSLEQQRTALLDATENLARRFGTDITVVFDGADVVGSHATRRRLVRVVYSPAGVLADDVIRDEVRRLPSGRNVVVVTNDQEIVRDVRSWGANPLPSNAFVAVL